MSRRLISFDSHIIDDVMRKVGDEYTRDQVEDVLNSSISYINCLCKYTDNVEVVIPGIGNMSCNLSQMDIKRRRLSKKLDKNKILSEEEAIELECLDKKIDDIKRYNNLNKIKKGDFKINRFFNYLRFLRHGLEFENIQDIQQKHF
jgi:hypothetical protein|nr:MAG TPA: hypothetical protein [Caudoviricetes sp.]DAY19004.1 MAG TPA: hypothetical protein [Caudoviricetes sp.]